MDGYDEMAEKLSEKLFDQASMLLKGFRDNQIKAGFTPVKAVAERRELGL